MTEIEGQETAQFIQKVVQKEHQYAFSKLEYKQKKQITSKMDQIEDKIVNLQILPQKLFILNQFKLSEVDKKIKFDTHKLISQINNQFYKKIENGEVKVEKRMVSRFQNQDLNNSSLYSGYQSGALSHQNNISSSYDRIKLRNDLTASRSAKSSNNLFSNHNHNKFNIRKEINKNLFWSNKQILEAPEAKEFQQLMKKMKEQKTDLEFKLRYHKELEQEKQKIEELSKIEEQQKNREEKKKHLLEKFEKQRKNKLQERRHIQEKQKEFSEFYNQYKNKDYLFKQKEQDFNKNQLSELENRKKKLQELRNLNKPIDKQALIDHENWYKDFKRQADERKQQQLQQKEQQSQLESQVFKQYYKGKAHHINEKEEQEKLKQQQKQEAIERRQKIKVYSQAVKDNFAPQINQKAHNDLEERVADLNRNKTELVKKIKKKIENDEEITEVEYVDLKQRDLKQIGQSYLQYNQQKAQKNGKIKTNTNFEEIEKQEKVEKYAKPQYQSKYTNNLKTNYEISLEQRELQQLQKEQNNSKLTSEEKNLRLLSHLEKIEQRVKQKEKQVSALYPSSITPKGEFNRSSMQNLQTSNKNQKPIKKISKNQSSSKSNNNNNQSEVHEKLEEIDNYYYTSMKAKLDILNSLNN